MPGITVEEFVRDQFAPLKLEVAAGSRALPERILAVADVHRPGLALSGWWGGFSAEAMQVLGNTERAYASSLEPGVRAAAYGKLVEAKPPAIVVTSGAAPPDELVRRAEAAQVPVLRTPVATTKFISTAAAYLEEKLAPTQAIHGTLVDVHGVGVLLIGPSGIGKSECALDLVDRGHRLVADDVVEIRRTAEGSLMGSASPLIQHHMEIRGLGVIQVQNVFGISATRDRKLVEFVAQLEEWQQSKEYDRLGLDERKHAILDVPLPMITIPVRPGRPLAVIIEVAAMNERLKRLGTHAARDLSRRLTEAMRPAPKNG